MFACYSGDNMSEKEFIKLVRLFYKKHRRDLPWRNTKNPYRILVSEIMLQQTQVARVIPKYKAFLKEFPTLAALSTAPTTQLLAVWKGLGYNRRALSLRRCAEQIVSAHGGTVPNTFAALVALPGIGPATAGDILAFAFKIPHVVIETNIRSVYLHHFFPKATSVSDTKLLPIIERTLDRNNPRDWYYALMDYGAHLKSTTGNASRRSKHHVKQSKFEGSHRQMRARVLFALSTPQSPMALARSLSLPLPLTQQVLSELAAEGFITKVGRTYKMS